ncbi:MAG: dihydrofolate reductase [bacterium]|nr:dihydrofolate reductase [bacterium]
MQTRINIIAAVGKNNRAIGKTGALLWRISDDLKRFKVLTMGHTIIMGRKTFDSIVKALPNRTNIVITRNKDFKAEGVVVAKSLEEARSIAQKQEETTPPSDKNRRPPLEQGRVGKEIFIIGGGEIYRQALPLADKLYLTLVESDAEGDTFFPDWRKDFTKEIFREERTDPKTGLKYAWVDVERN